MSRTTVPSIETYTCDKCKEEVEEGLEPMFKPIGWTHIERIPLPPIGKAPERKYRSRSVDLCSSCTVEFLEWIG